MADLLVDLLVSWVRFKTSYLGPLEQVLDGLGQALPDLSVEDRRQLLETTYFLMVGMWPSAHPAPAVREALERPELTSMCIDFEPRLQQMLATAIRGLRAAR